MNSSGVGKDTIRGLQEIDTSKGMMQAGGIRRNRARRMDPVETTNGLLARFNTVIEAKQKLKEKFFKRNSVMLRPSRRPRFNPASQVERASSGLQPENGDLQMNTFYRAPIGQEQWAIKHIEPVRKPRATSMMA